MINAKEGGVLEKGGLRKSALPMVLENGALRTGSLSEALDNRKLRTTILPTVQGNRRGEDSCILSHLVQIPTCAPQLHHLPCDCPFIPYLMHMQAGAVRRALPVEHAGNPAAAHASAQCGQSH